MHSTGEGLPTGVQDPSYTIVAAPSGAILNPGGATDTVPPLPGLYMNPPSGTQWIGPNVNGLLDEPTGNYDYQTTFNLAGFDPATTKITGTVYSDNTLFDIELNGVSLGISGGGLTTPVNYTITSGFSAGINTLDFIVTNVFDPIPPNPTALLVVQSGIATAVPEPTSIVLRAMAAISLLTTCHYFPRKDSNGDGNRDAIGDGNKDAIGIGESLPF